nr:copia protein [Tanacetum cinerariifolium]
MAALRYRDEHNKVGYLLKPTGSDDYHQIIDFLRASHIRSPELDPPAIQDTIDETPYTITKDLNKFSPQWRFLVHTILHCLSTKSGSWDQFGSPLAVALICLSDGRQFNWSNYIFKGMVSNIGNAKRFLMYPRFLQAILDPNIASFSRTHETDADPFTNVEDEPLGGSFHMSSPSSTQAPSACQTSGSTEELITLTALSSVVSTLVQKVNTLETKLKDHKKLFKDVVGKLVKKVKAMKVKLRTSKRKMVVSDSDQKEGGKQDVDLNALLALANADVTVDSNISPGSASDNPAASTSIPANVPTSENVPTGSTSVLADVPTNAAPAGVSNKGKTPMIKEDITADWINIMAQVEANASLSKTLLGDDVSEDNFPARMAALIKRKKQALAEKLAKERKDMPMTQGQQRTYMRQFVKNQKELEKIQKALSNIQIHAFSRTLKRTSPVLEEPSSKRQKSTEAPIPSMPEVPPSPVASSPKSSGIRRKSLGRNRLTMPKSKLKELDLDADAQTFIKVVSNEDSKDEAPRLWSALVGWKVIPTPLGDINALYRINWSTTYFTTLRKIFHMVDRQGLLMLYGLVVKYYANHPVAGGGLILWGDLQVLFNSQEGEVVYMFADVPYPLSVKLMERMLTHKLEIDKDVVGNDMTTAEQLIRVFNSPMLHLLRVKMVINSPWIMPILRTKELASPEQTTLDCDYYEKKMAQTPARNHAQRGNHQQYTRMTHLNRQRHVVPTAVLTKSKLLPLTAARPVTTAIPQPHVTRPRPAKTVVTKPHSPPRRNINHRPSPKVSTFPPKVTITKASMVNDVQGVQGNWIWKPKCPILDHVSSHTSASMTLKRFNYNDALERSKYMTGNMSYLSDFEEINGGYVAFGGNPKGGKITGKRVPRENNMYNVDLKNIIPSGDLTCLFAKATLDESNLWHRRLGHINYKTMNKLVKGNLVRGLPSKVFKNNHTCVACKKGKQHRASYKTKPVSSVSKPLQRVLVTKPHNKTPYELLLSRTPSIGFMRPFDCPVTILNTLDPLGKFDGKADVGFLVGYSNIDGDAVFKVKEPEFEGRKPESEVHVSPSSSAQTKKHDDKTKREAKGKSPIELSTRYRNLKADFTNLETNITISPIPKTRVHNDHHVTQIIGNLSSATQTRSMIRVVKDQGELTQINNEDFHTCMFSCFLSQEESKREEGIDYEEVFAPVARIEATRLFLAYASFMGFMVYQINVKSVFLYETIEEEVYVYQPLGFEDPDYPDKRGKIDQTLFIKKQKGDILLVQVYVDDIIFGSTNKDVCKAFEKLMKDKFQMSSMGELTFFLDVQVKKVNDVTRLQALIDRKKVIITEAKIREAPRLDDVESIDCLPNEEIFTELSRMGYEKPSTKLTFYKAFFSPQWKFLIHAILQCMSAKRTSWNEFSSSMASVVICLSTCRKFSFSKYIFNSLVRNVDSSIKFYMYPRFLQLMIRAQVGDLSSHTTKYSSPALTKKVFANMRRVGKGFFGVETPLFKGMIVEQQSDDVADEGVAGVDIDVVPAAEPSIPSPTLTTQPPPPSQELPSTSQKVEALEQDKVAQALDIINLKQRVKKLERKNKLKVYGLRRLRKVETTQRIESSADTVMDDQEDASKQGEIIANIDADEDVILNDVAAVEKTDEIEENADVQGRSEESQAQIYKIDLEHADNVLSMQDDELEPAELKEVVEVVTTAKLMTEVVTAASATITAPTTLITGATITDAPSAARRRKRVVIRDTKEIATPSIIIYSEPKSKDKGKRIMVEEPKPLKRQAQIEQDEAYAREYQALKRKPQTEAQARKNMMIYLSSMAGFKMDYFKGMSYEDFRLIFKKYFNSNVSFLEKSKEQLEEEASRALKRASESQEEKAVKKQKLDEEVEELKKHLQIVPNNDDDV